MNKKCRLLGKGHMVYLPVPIAIGIAALIIHVGFYFFKLIFGHELLAKEFQPHSAFQWFFWSGCKHILVAIIIKAGTGCAD